MTSLSGNHKIIPLAWGACASENNSDLKEFYHIIKNCINDATLINAFIMDEGPALNSSTKTEFPNAIIRNCYIHKKSNLQGKEKSLFSNLIFANTKTEFNTELDRFIKKNEYSEPEAEKLTNMMKSYSPLFSPVTTQDILTNGTCESINSILKQMDNSSIISYCDKLYDYMRTNIENMCEGSLHGYTHYYNKIINSYNCPISRSIKRIEKDANANTINVEEVINQVNYTFQVTKDQGVISCTCYKDKALSCGCVHIYKALQAFPDFGTFDKTVHNGYKVQHIQDFLKTLPPRTKTDDLTIDQEINFISKADRRKNKSRILCALDHNK